MRAASYGRQPVAQITLATSISLAVARMSRSIAP
jgi:hypothetical protein